MKGAKVSPPKSCIACGGARVLRDGRDCPICNRNEPRGDIAVTTEAKLDPIRRRYERLLTEENERHTSEVEGILREYSTEMMAAQQAAPLDLSQGLPRYGPTFTRRPGD